MLCMRSLILFFFFNDTATTEIYTLSLHDALPIFPIQRRQGSAQDQGRVEGPGFVRAGKRPPQRQRRAQDFRADRRSEEHTSELQSRQYLVCRLLLEKKK